MIALLLSLAASCAAPQSSEAKVPAAANDLFPEPKSGISIRLEPGKEMKLDVTFAESHRPK